MSRVATAVAAAGFLALLFSLGDGTSVSAQPGASRVLLAEVLGSANQPILGLQPDDFAVDERGELREVFAAYPADYPVVLLVDDTGAEDEFKTIRAAVDHLIGRLGQRPVVLGTLSRTDLLTTLDDDRSTLLERLKNLSPVSDNPPNPYNALTTAVRMLEDAETVFSAIVVVSSRPEESEEGGIARPLAPLLQSRAIVHSVIRNSRPQSPLDPGDRQTGLLLELANQTGGQYIPIYAPGSYSVALDRVADRLAAETIIEYIVPQGSVPGGAVRVGVKIPGARVRGLGFGRSGN